MIRSFVCLQNMVCPFVCWFICLLVCSLVSLSVINLFVGLLDCLSAG